MSTTTNPNDCGKDTDTDGLWGTIHHEVDDCQKAGKCDERKIYPNDGYAGREIGQTF
jgi:hypothetical protein